MTADAIRTVCFVGAGTMGCANALLAAISGYRVVMFDLHQESLEAVPAIQQEMAAYLVGMGYCDESVIAPALSGIRFTTDLIEATAEADLVSESVYERLEVKHDVHRQLDAICPAATILTTNTSGFLVSEIESVVERGDRFAALHSHLGSLLFDIVGGPRTSPETIATLQNYVFSLSAVPLILKKEYPGYVMNSMLGPTLAMAKLLVIEGLSGIETVDRAWMIQHNSPIGPFGMMDFFGLDVVYDAWGREEAEPYRQSWQTKIRAFLMPYIDAGSLGRKSDSGFYQYPNASYEQPGFVSENADDGAVSSMLLVAWIQSAIWLLIDDVAEPADIDKAWTVSTGHAAGPLATLERIGRERFAQDFYQPALDSGLIPDALSQPVLAFLR